jgi:hypothetical protein
VNQPQFPDPARSRAVLIGSSHFTAADPDLPGIPAVQANLTGLRRALTHPAAGVFRPEFCRSLANPANADEVGSALSDMAATATDLLLVYYTGHGILGDLGRLHLALPNTNRDRLRWTAIPFEVLRDEIAASGATARVLVLDCCFSGRAITAMADTSSLLSSQFDLAGTYTLTATPANAPAHAPCGDRYTAFTGAFLHALEGTTTLTLDQIYAAIDRDLAARHLPRPQRRAVNAGGDLALCRGPIRTHAEPVEPDSDSVRFAGVHPATRVLQTGLRELTRESPFVALICVLAFIYLTNPTLAADWFLALVSVAGSLWFLALLFSFGFERRSGFIFWLPVLIVSRPFERLGRIVALLVATGKISYVRELAVDRSGLIVRVKHASTVVPWRDVVQVGVLQPEPDMLNQYRTTAQRKDVLVVRLRPEVPAPEILSVLSDEHRRLGYLGVCTLEEISISSPEMLGALQCSLRASCTLPDNSWIAIPGYDLTWCNSPGFKWSQESMANVATLTFLVGLHRGCSYM